MPLFCMAITPSTNEMYMIITKYIHIYGLFLTKIYIWGHVPQLCKYFFKIQYLFGEKNDLKMYPTQNRLRYPSRRNQNNNYWNIDFSCLCKLTFNLPLTDLHGIMPVFQYGKAIPHHSIPTGPLII